MKVLLVMGSKQSRLNQDLIAASKELSNQIISLIPDWTSGGKQELGCAYVIDRTVSPPELLRAGKKLDDLEGAREFARDIVSGVLDSFAHEWEQRMKRQDGHTKILRIATETVHQHLIAR